MLSTEENEFLTRVGPGTPVGNLLRRYWFPACLSSEIEEPDGPPTRIRLLGESLVAFRDTDGQVGVMDELCPHRGASLFYGRNEVCGLRCTYHGWKKVLAEGEDWTGARNRRRSDGARDTPRGRRDGAVYAGMVPPAAGGVGRRCVDSQP